MLDENDFKKHHYSENEEFIAKAMDYLKYSDPDHATREDAITFIEFIQTVGTEISKTGSLSFEDFFEQYQKQQPKQ